MGDARQGTCGKNLTWIFEDGVLTISGTGEMEDFKYDIDYFQYVTPWLQFKFDIRSVHIQFGITSIGIGAFSSSALLQKINIPDSVTSIGEYAFEGCSSLIEIHIPDSVTSIGEFAFIFCRSLKVIDIPDNVTSIEKCTSYGCSGLKAIRIPNSVTSIGCSAFDDCTSLKDVYYSGTKAQWFAIEIDEDNQCLKSAKIHCKKEDPAGTTALHIDEKTSVEESVVAKSPVKENTNPQATMTVPAAPEINSTGSVPTANQQPVPYSGNKPYIFFSYSHKNMEPAMKLIRLLQSSGYRVWYDDEIKPIAEFTDYIAEHIDACSCAVSLVSEAYLNSKFCKKEIFYAESIDIPQLLIYMEDISLTGAWKLNFGLLQHITYQSYSDEQKLMQKLLQTDSISQCREEMPNN